MSVNHSEDNCGSRQQGEGQKRKDQIHLTAEQRKYITTGLVILAVYLAMRYVSPVLSPFLLAFLIAGALNPFICKFHKKTGMQKPLLAGIIVSFCCVLIILIFWGLSFLLIEGGAGLTVVHIP